MSSHLLALETSGARCGVALLCHDGPQARVVARHHDGVNEHSARLLPLVDEVLAEAGIRRQQLDGIAFGQGPGAFTGIRVACGVAQGMGFALDRPLIPVLTHEALEHQVPPQAAAWRLVVQDARMDEAYVAVVQRTAQGPTVLEGPLLLPLTAVSEWHAGWAAHAGQTQVDWLWVSDLDGDTAASAVRHLRQSGLAVVADFPAVRPTATAVAEVAWQHWLAGVRVSPEAARPVYVRDKVAFTTAERAGGAGGNPRAAIPGTA